MALPLWCSPAPAPSEWTFEQRMRESFRLLEHMHERGVSPDPSHLCPLLHFASSHRSLRHTRVLHSRALRLRLHHHPSVATALVSAYASCGLLPLARHLFDEMPHKTPSSWTVAIAMYHRADLPHESLSLYRSMLSSSPETPNAFTYATVLGACARAKDAVIGRRVHDDATRNGCDADRFVAAALVDMYAKCGSIVDARQVFDTLSHRNPVACTAMIEGYNSTGMAHEALNVFREVLRSADARFVKEMGLAGVIKACELAAAVERATEVHAYMVKSRLNPGRKAMRRLVELYARSGRMVLASRLARVAGLENKDQWSRVVIGKGGRADALALRRAIEACVELRSLEGGRQLHGRAVKVGAVAMDGLVVQALASMYSKCEDAEAAGRLRDR